MYDVLNNFKARSARVRFDDPFDTLDFIVEIGSVMSPKGSKRSVPNSILVSLELIVPKRSGNMLP